MKRRYLWRLNSLQECKGGLYHLCGGHVFNTKRKDVSDFFGVDLIRNEIL